LFYLEGHVLQEVSGTVVLGGLGTGTGINENTDGGGLGRGVRLGSDGQSVLEGGDAGAGDGSSSGKRADSLVKNEDGNYRLAPGLTGDNFLPER